MPRTSFDDALVWSSSEAIVNEQEVGRGRYRLTCSCKTYRTPLPGTVPWCAHLMNLVNSDKDTSPALGNKLHPQQIVTIFQDPGMNVLIDLKDVPGDLRQVILRWRSDTSEDYNYTLGFIGMTDGRRVIRQLVLEFLCGLPLMPCLTKWHLKGKSPCDDPEKYTRSDEDIEAGMLPYDKELIVDNFDILVTSACRNCNRTQPEGEPF